MDRNLTVDRLRAIAMLGVLGIHISTFVLASSTPRLDLFLLLGIFTRFAVPAFFFISGYGLFRRYPLERPFDHIAFLKKHFFTVGIPYLVWSMYYIALWQWEDMYRPDRSFSVSVLLVKLLLGEGCYHIYFLVLLMAFYVTLPLWRYLVKKVDAGHAPRRIACLLILLALQIALYVWSASYWVYPPYLKGHAMILRLLNERINYIPFFYGFVFILGALSARHEKTVRDFLGKSILAPAMLFAASSLVMLCSFFRKLSAGVELERIPGYMTQLTPEGLFYTIACIYLFCAVLQRWQGKGTGFLDFLSRHSFMVYLVHPSFIHFFYYLIEEAGYSFDRVPVLVFYLMVLFASLAFARISDALFARVPVLGLLLLGRRGK